MKKAAVVLAVVVMVVSLVSLGFAADLAAGSVMKGTIKSVDAKASSIVLKTDAGKEETLLVDKSVALAAVGKKDEVEVSIDKNVVTSLKITKKARAAMGC